MDKWNMRSQSAIEFMVFIGILITIFIFMLLLYSNAVYNRVQEQESMLANDLLSAIQLELNLASRVNDGYYKEFKIPQKLELKDYSLVQSGNEIAVIFSRQDFETKIPSIIGTVQKGINIIRKENGIVYVNS